MLNINIFSSDINKQTLLDAQNCLGIRTFTIDFGNTEWHDVGHILRTRSLPATVELVAHRVAPNVAGTAAAGGFISNKQAL